MKDIRHVFYEFEQVYNYFPARFIRDVSLFPLVGPTLDPEAIKAATRDVLEQWRARIPLFKKWELSPHLPVREGGRDKLFWMYNCPPAFVKCRPAGKPCGVKLLCPFCAARAALEIWQPIDHTHFGVRSPAVSLADLVASGQVLPRALTLDADFDIDAPEAPAKVKRLDGQTLVTRSITYSLPFGGKYTLEGMLNFRLTRSYRASGKARRRSDGMQSRYSEIARLKAAGFDGGLETTHIGLKYASDGTASTATGWRLEFRQVMLLPSARFAEVIAHPHVAVAPTTKVEHSPVVLEHVELPTRRDMMNAIATGLRISRVPLYGSREHVTEYLAARKGHRTSTTFGSFYGVAATKSEP